MDRNVQDGAMAERPQAILPCRERIPDLMTFFSPMAKNADNHKDGLP